MKIYAFGNEFIESDSLAKELASKLLFRGYEVVFADKPDVLFDERKAVILDVAENISSPILIDKPEQIKTSKVLSLHDLDLANYIKLLSLLHNFEFKLIAIPYKGNKEKILNKVISLLSEINQ